MKYINLERSNTENNEAQAGTLRALAKEVKEKIKLDSTKLQHFEIARLKEVCATKPAVHTRFNTRITAVSSHKNALAIKVVPTITGQDNTYQRCYIGCASGDRFHWP